MSQFWTATEIGIAKKLRAQGTFYKDMAGHLPGRTEGAIRRFFAVNKWARESGAGAARGGIGPVTAAILPPAKVFEDREKRALEPRTLTMELMGDPCFSQSALARLRGKDTGGRAQPALPGGSIKAQ